MANYGTYKNGCKITNRRLSMFSLQERMKAYEYTPLFEKERDSIDKFI